LKETPRQHAAAVAWLPASATVGLLSVFLAASALVGRHVPENYMVRLRVWRAAKPPRLCQQQELRRVTTPHRTHAQAAHPSPARRNHTTHAPARHTPQDEPFHVPMTQRYCRGHLLDWDPKITTFPGLYVLGALYAHACAALLAWATPGDALVCVGGWCSARAARCC
jgi:hypothetical protein